LQDNPLNILTYLYIKQHNISNTTQTQTLSSLHKSAPQPVQSSPVQTVWSPGNTSSSPSPVPSC